MNRGRDFPVLARFDEKIVILSNFGAEVVVGAKVIDLQFDFIALKLSHG